MVLRTETVIHIIVKLLFGYPSKVCQKALVRTFKNNQLSDAKARPHKAGGI